MEKIRKKSGKNPEKIRKKIRKKIRGKSVKIRKPDEIPEKKIIISYL